MKHFEDIWNEAEFITTKLPDKLITSHIREIKAKLGKLENVLDKPSEVGLMIGSILFDVCYLTYKLNINSAAALKTVVEFHKINLLDPDENNQNENT